MGSQADKPGVVSGASPALPDLTEQQEERVEPLDKPTRVPLDRVHRLLDWVLVPVTLVTCFVPWSGIGLSWMTLLPTTFAFIWYFPLSAVIDKFENAQARRMVLPHGGKICLRCHYPLSILEPEGRCPECGITYRHADLIAVWRKHYQLHDVLPAVGSPIEPPS